MNPDALPTILERKRTLTGAEKRYPCRVLARGPGALTVLFVSDRVFQAGGLTLPVGTQTFGHFWADRPYNVYHWLDPRGATLAHYFNLCDATKLGDSEFAYLDLTVDVLVRPGGAPRLLDVEELPPALPVDVRARLATALAQVLSQVPVLIPALEKRADELWATLHGVPRR